MAAYALICLLFVIVLIGFRTLCARATTAQKAGVTMAAAVLALEENGNVEELEGYKQILKMYLLHS